jgi:hypothetical protein
MRRPLHLAARARTLAGVLALAILDAPGVAAQALTYDGALSYSRGSYIFTEPTNSFWLSTGLSLRAGRFSLSASLPVIVQNSGLISFVAGQPVATGGEDSGAVGRRNKGEPVGTHDGSGRGTPGGTGVTVAYGGSRQESADPLETDSTTVFFRGTYEVQVGDPLFFGSMEVYSSPGTLRSITVSASAKAPLRSVESGVGTGAWDVGGGATIAAGTGRNLFLADVSYWSYGDLPDLELDSGWIWGLSASHSFGSGRMALSASVSGATALTENVEAPMSVGVSAMVLPVAGRALSAGIWFGLTEAAPDISLSLAWSLRLAG